MQTAKQIVSKPVKLAVGDCFIGFKGAKPRPCVIFCIDKKLVYALALSTTKNEFYLADARLSRFFDAKITKSYFAKGIVTATETFASENYCYSYEHLDCLFEAVEKQISLINFITL